jgi:hypothetical protein
MDELHAQHLPPCHVLQLSPTRPHQHAHKMTQATTHAHMHTTHTSYPVDLGDVDLFVVRKIVGYALSILHLIHKIWTR